MSRHLFQRFSKFDPRSLARSLATAGLLACAAQAQAQPQPPAPAPLLSPGHAVDWWIAFKFNVATSPTSADDPRRNCDFGGQPQAYKKGFGQDYIVASAEDPHFTAGTALIGTADDPLGTTFRQVYEGDFSYVVWNDQFYGDPHLGCGTACGEPWAHSKGFVAWDDSGAGLVVQVSTPSWPGSGSRLHPRTDGNTLGCVTDNDVKVSQHFFALKLSPADTAKLLEALRNEAAVTLPADPQVVRVRPSSPPALKTLAASLGARTPGGASLERFELDSGVTLISKPAALHAPPWLVVSALLGGEPLRVATWWTGTGGLPSTHAVKPACWSGDLGAPGEIEVAMTGTWHDPIGLAGGNNPKGNHAKIGTSLADGHHLTILGDMNEDGRLMMDCHKEQNGRGGLFFVLADPELWTNVSALLKGQTAAYGDRTVAEGASPWTPPAPVRRRRSNR